MKSVSKNFIDKIATHPIQTWEWGEFRQEWGNEVLYTEHGLLTLHRMLKTKYKLATFLRGPKPTQKMLTDLKKIAKENNLIFIKMEPNFAMIPGQDRDDTVALLKAHGAVKGKTFFTPTSFWIDLTRPEEDLLKSFKGKTRYNIRLAKKKGVTVVEDNSTKAFNSHINLTRETVRRQRFFSHNGRYHRLMWKHLRATKSPIAHLLVAKYKKEILATWILFKWKDTLYYPYGASSEKHKNVMAQNLMMWEAIRFGKRRGLMTFDLWGREPGKGFTNFKEGYNPEVVEFIGTWDLVVNPTMYKLYKAADIARWAALRTKSKFTNPNF